jgi:hypothetical protein
MQNPNIIKGQLFPCENKLTHTQPDLRGTLQVDGQSVAVAAWTRRTQRGDRLYHSVSLSKPFNKGEVREALAGPVKLYEFRKHADSDPDFQSSESFQLLGKSYHLALWVEIGSGDELEAIRFTVGLIEQPFRPSLTDGCKETLADIRGRIVEIRRESQAYRELEVKSKAPADKDEEPDELPF